MKIIRWLGGSGKKKCPPYHVMLSFLGPKKSTQTFFVQSFSTTLRVMDVRAENRGRPHQKVRFPAAPVVGRNFLTPGHPGVRVRNVRAKSGPKSLCLCCFFFPDFRLFSTRDFRAPLLRLGDGSLLPKLNGPNGARFAVLFPIFSQLCADLSCNLHHLGGADLRRKSQETADFVAAEFPRNPFVACSLSLLPSDTKLLLTKNYFQIIIFQKLRISRVIPRKDRYFPEILRVQTPSKITKNNSQGIIFVILSCQRVVPPQQRVGERNISTVKRSFPCFPCILRSTPLFYDPTGLVKSPKAPETQKYEKITKKIQNSPPRLGSQKYEQKKPQKYKSGPKMTIFFFFGIFFSYFWGPIWVGGFGGFFSYFFRILGFQGFLGSLPGPRDRNPCFWLFELSSSRFRDSGCCRESHQVAKYRFGKP